MRVLARSILDELTGQARASPRGRAHYNIHAAPSDPVQRFIVVANRDSYFRPHRHRVKAELALILRGGFDVVTFDEAGRVTARGIAGEGAPGMAYEMPPDTWHTLMARVDGSAFLEVKQGPYDPATASEFAPWAPAEGAASVPEFLDWLRAAQPGSLSAAKFVR
jgi:cupin fold WbuC family metalloprotein